MFTNINYSKLICLFDKYKLLIIIYLRIIEVGDFEEISSLRDFMVGCILFSTTDILSLWDKQTTFFVTLSGVEGRNIRPYSLFVTFISFTFICNEIFPLNSFSSTA